MGDLAGECLLTAPCDQAWIGIIWRIRPYVDGNFQEAVVGRRQELSPEIMIIRLSDHFDKATLQRGQDYARRGLVGSVEALG